MKKLLKDICTQIRGVSYKPTDIRSESDGIPILRANNIQDDGIGLDDLVYVDAKKVHDEQYLQNGDIVICASSGSKNLVGKAATYNKNIKASFGAFCKTVRVNKSNDICLEFIQQFFQSKAYRNAISELSIGANINNIKTEHIDELEINLPPIPEQEQIAATLDKLQSAINNKKQQLTLLDEAVKSEFVEMFGEEPVESGKWKVRKLGDVASDVKYGTSYSAVENGQYKYLRMNNLTSDGYLNLEDLKFIDISDDEYEKFVVRKGDILFNRTNSREHVGKTTLYNLDEEMIIAGYLIRVRFYKEVNPYFFVQFMNIPYMKRVLKKTARGAVNQANINSQELKSLLIPVPPINLQNQFAAFVQQIDKSKFVLHQQLKFTEKYAIMFKEIK